MAPIAPWRSVSVNIRRLNGRGGDTELSSFFLHFAVAATPFIYTRYTPIGKKNIGNVNLMKVPIAKRHPNVTLRSTVR